MLDESAFSSRVVIKNSSSFYSLRICVSVITHGIINIIVDISAVFYNNTRADSLEMFGVNENAGYLEVSLEPSVSRETTL